jgi:hypothetical protein
MTPDLDAMAETLSADLATLHRAGRISSPWLAGMLAWKRGHVRERVLGTTTLDRYVTGAALRGPRAGTWHVTSLSIAVPDLSDPVTCAALLLLVREAWGDPTASTAATREGDGSRGWVMDCWEPRSPLHSLGPFGTEVAALCAAIHAATTATHGEAP